jgi:hypothetical protein
MACPRCRALDELLEDFEAHGGSGPGSGVLTPDLIRALIGRRARDLSEMEQGREGAPPVPQRLKEMRHEP